MKTITPLLLCVSLLYTASARGQGLPAPLDITAGSSIVDETGSLLPGSNPNSDAFGYPVVSGCLVQILAVGGNGVPDLPQADGSPGGDDSLWHTIQIGEGISPARTLSGRFSKSIYEYVPQGSRYYARAFNATDLADATHWGQSEVFTLQGQNVFDVSKLGLWGTTLPLGADLAATDSDGDGLSDAQEMRANTSATDAGDHLKTQSASAVYPEAFLFDIDAKAGRSYRLMRYIGRLSEVSPADWMPMLESAVMESNQSYTLIDHNPPLDYPVYYKVEVLQP